MTEIHLTDSESSPVAREQSQRRALWRKPPIVRRAALCSLFLLAGSAFATEGRPTPVSPGALEQVTEVNEVCPTFNWAGVEKAVSYDLAVFAAPSEADGATVARPGDVPLRPILRHRIPGGALGWTPPAGRCLQRGGTYGWVVRAVGPQGPGIWSEPYSFQVTNLPSEEAVRSALDVLRVYLAEEDGTPSAPSKKAAGGRAGQDGHVHTGETSDSPHAVSLSGLDIEHQSAAHLVLTNSGSSPPPPPPPPISLFSVDGTGSVSAPTVTANAFVGNGAQLTSVNATSLGGKSRYYFTDGTHDHHPRSVCDACEVSPTPGCASLCELHFPTSDALEARCFGTLFDSGGPSGEYDNSQNVLLTVCSPIMRPIYAIFRSFEIEETYDFLHVFDGLGTPTNRCGSELPTPAPGQTLLGSFDGSNSPGYQYGPSGCLAFLLCSDSSVVAPGWEADIFCAGSP